MVAVTYTSNSNYEWSKERGVGATPYPPVTTLEEMRHAPEFAVVTPEQCIDLAKRLGRDAELVFQPLMGGMPPENGWRSLELFASAVLPALVADDFR